MLEDSYWVEGLLSPSSFWLCGSICGRDILIFPGMLEYARFGYSLVLLLGGIRYHGYLRIVKLLFLGML